jgi:hypothetical protein
MQELIGDVIRAIGWGALRFVSIGRYRGGESDRLSEGAVGFALVVLAIYLVAR